MVDVGGRCKKPEILTGILRDSGRREEILAGFLKKGYWDVRGEVTKNKHLHSSGLEERQNTFRFL